MVENSTVFCGHYICKPFLLTDLTIKISRRFFLTSKVLRK